ncbi:unnamed protein product [Lactuca saligna]|uniref:Uncharacterized protein n=1 Tax=Lactuca saligna TaxID=75948 RepID=A0AA35ZTM0_LACSI|nr:unnamed protein product [Lactuca saligna]
MVQSSDRMAGDLCYAATQTSTLMVATDNQVCLAGANKRQLKVLQGALTGMREEVHDSEAERQDPSERLEDQVSSLIRKKGTLASEFARYQRQLAHARVDGMVAREFANGVRGVREACEALGFEKEKQLSGCSTRAREPEVLDPSPVARRVEEVYVTLSSIAETDFVGLFRLGSWIMTASASFAVG